MPANADLSRFDDLFAPFGRILVRPMFGGEGLFRDGIMFGLVWDERIFLKASETTRIAFVAEGCEAFTYKTKKGEGTLTSYYALPDHLYDDPDDLAEWARTAFGVALQSPTGRKKQRNGVPASQDKARRS
jgi:DNA transformation protein